MLMKRWRWLVALALIVALTFAAAAPGLADAGDFAGDSDWGGSSSWDSGSDWGSSSDWGSGSDWSSSDWSSSGSSWGGSSWSSGSSNISYDDSDDSFGGGLVALIVIAVIAFIVIRNLKKNGANSARPGSLYTAKQDTTPGLPLSDLKAKDPNFNEQKFLEQVGNHYIQMQDAWEKKDWEPMRAIMTDSLYNQMERQLEELKKRGMTNYVDRIAVLDAFISKYYVEGENDVLIVRLSTRICDYTVNDQTGEVVRGSKTRELFMTYDWKLIRDKNRKTLEEDAMTSVSCPSCGAPLSLKQSGKCPYCDTVITLTDHDWALSVVKGISQRSSGK